MATDGNRDNYYNGKIDRVSDFIIYFNIFGEFDNFADWDGAQLCSAEVDQLTTDQLLRSSLSGHVAGQRKSLTILILFI